MQALALTLQACAFLGPLPRRLVGVHAYAWVGVPPVKGQRVRKKRAETVGAGEIWRDGNNPEAPMHALVNLQRNIAMRARPFGKAWADVQQRKVLGARSSSPHHGWPGNAIPQISRCRSKPSFWVSARNI